MGNRYAHVATNDPRDNLVETGGSRFLSSASNHSQKGTKYLQFVHTDSVAALTTVRNNLIVTGSKDSTLALLNMDSAQTLQRWIGHGDEVTKLAYSHTGGQHVLYSASRDTSIRGWLFNEEKSVSVLAGHQLTVSGLAAVQDGKIISGSRDASVRMWDPETSLVIREEHINRNLVTHIAVNQDATLAAQSSEDKELKIWDARTLELVNRFPKMNNILMNCDWTSDGHQVIVSCNGFNGDGCEITVWDMRTMKKFRDLRGHEASVTGVAYIHHHDLQNKRLVASCSLDRSVKIWNIEDGAILWTEELAVGADLLAICVPSDRRIVVTGGKGLVADLSLQSKAGRPFLQLHSLRKCE